MDTNEIKRLVKAGLGSVRQALRGLLAGASGAKQVIIIQGEGAAGEQFADAEMFQQPGFRSIGLPGMQPIIVPLNGTSANGVVVAMSNGKLFISNLAPGEVAIFNENAGVANSIILRNGGVIDIQCDTLNINATTAVNITTPTLQVHASSTVQINTATMAISANSVPITAPTITASGALDVVGRVKSQGVSLPDHKHPKITRGLQDSDPPSK